MHVLAMKHIVDISPAVLVVGKVIDTDGFPSSPVAVDEFTQYHRITTGDIYIPFMQPSSAVGST